MRHADANLALTKFDRERDVDGNWESVVPKEPGMPHAVLQPPWNDQPEIFEYDYPEALCGTRIKVILPLHPDDKDSQLCIRCAHELDTRAKDPRAWDAEQQRKMIERRQRRNEREDYEAYKERERLRREGGPRPGP